MLKQQALDAVYSNGEIDALKMQLAAKGAPVEDMINDLIDQNLNSTAAQLVKRVIAALRDELDRISAEEGKTKAGKIWRAVWQGKLGTAISLLFGKKAA